jgi:hypothetical protein
MKLYTSSKPPKVRNEENCLKCFRCRNCKDGYQEYLDSARIIQRWWRRKRALIRRDNEIFDSEQVDERFKTMKLMSPVADPIDLNCAFLDPDRLVVSTRSERRRRQSPEQKWIVPEQTVELKPDGISLPALTPVKPRLRRMVQHSRTKSSWCAKRRFARNCKLHRTEQRAPGLKWSRWKLSRPQI